MSAQSFDKSLAQLEEQINNCEKAVKRFIKVKRKMPSKDSMSMNKVNRQLQHNPIAIVGMASIFPQARNIKEYWQNIVDEIDCITDIPDTHWNVEDYYDSNPRTKEDKTYCNKGGFIPSIDFNPMEFGIPPNILEVTDVSQLLSLVVAKEAMEDAGYSEKREFNRENVGVVLGSAALKLGVPLSSRLQYPIWKKALKSSGLSDEDTQKIIEKIQSAYVQWDENAFPGMLSNVISGRIANRFNLGGLNCTVDAACASSLAALKMAIAELVDHRCDMMLTGGVDTDNSVSAYISFSKTPAVSPGDKVKPFDAKSDGMMLGEGLGMIVLKRLSDAERDNDKIYAVIKGIGTSSDGRFKSIYAPRKEGQIKALQRAYEDAGFDPATVNLVEAHGTGTMAGDPTEFASLREYFSEDTSKGQHIALGSVKSQIGHTKAAAGAASLIKTALALHHKVLPPSINVTQPNPKLNIKNSPFYLNTETRPWIRAKGEAPRRAGVSSFGFGGTNYHVVLEEHNSDHKSPYRLHNAPAQILLFEDNHALLVQTCEQTLDKLQSTAGDKHYSELIEASKFKEIPQSSSRIGFVASSLTETCKRLKAAIDLLKNKPSATEWEHPTGIHYRAEGLNLKGKVVALFSGQGSQYLNMGKEVLINFPQLRQLYGYMDSLLLKDNLQPLSEIVFPHPVFGENEKNAQIAALQRTEYAQPAIGMLSAGYYKVLQQAGFKPDFVAGHSFGELTALWASQALSDADYCALVKARGQAMAAPEDPNYDTGAMLAVKEDLGKIESVLKKYPQVKIANLNSPRQVVLAGHTPDIHELQKVLHDSGCAAVVLPVAAAFHTPLIAFAQKAFAIATKSVTFKSPKTPVYTNVTGKQHSTDPKNLQKTLESQLSNSVLFKQEIENIYADGGYCFVEFGPRKILTNLVKDILADKPHMAIALNSSPRKDSDYCLREAVIQLRVAGITLKNLDPYQVAEPVKPAETKKGLNIKLNGSNYVSEKTKQRWEKAISEQHQVQIPAAKPVEAVATKTATVSVDKKTGGQGDRETRGQGENIENFTSSPTSISNNNGNGHKKVVEIKQKEKKKQGDREIKEQENKIESSTPSTPSTPSPAPSPTPQTNSELNMHMQSKPNNIPNYEQVLESLEYVLTQFGQNQNENLQVHSQYLNHQVEYIRTFFRLMEQQNTLFARTDKSETLKPKIIESLERGMVQFHSHQGDTLKVHEQYLQDQVEYTKNFFQHIQQEYEQLVQSEGITEKQAKTSLSVPVTSQIAPQTAEKTANQTTSTNGSTPVVETKPEPKPEPVAATTNQTSQPELENTVSEETEEIEEIEEIPATATTTLVESKPEPISENGHHSKPETSSSELSVSSSVDLSDLDTNLLAITSEKTGYPVEMLEMDMDMEADLGIDSIKRVEIMGALQEMYPDLPKSDNVEELSELRTIGQIVEYLQSLSDRGSNSNIVEIQTAEVEVSQPVADIPAAETTVESVESSAIETIEAQIPTEIVATSTDTSNLGQTMLEITSEKTGYPVEMLEMEMDMEADLGIDSIKRVEIMGALQEAYPDLPKPDNLEEISELRTIGQIVEYLQSLSGGEKKKLQSHTSQPLNEIEGVVRYPAILQPLPEPDFIEFELPEGNIVLITDDGSSTTSELAELLSQSGLKVVVLSFPQSVIPGRSVLPSNIKNIILEDTSEKHLQQQLKAIATNCGSIGAFIHIHPTFNPTSSGVNYSPEEKTIVKQVFFITKHIKKSLKAAAENGHSCFCTVTRLDGAFGLEQKINFSPIAGGLFGLTKTLTWECGQVFCRAIDIHPQIDTQNCVKHIQAELHDPNHLITEVGYGTQGRTTITVNS
ncbi:beta-ketoacyl synthase [Calothrix parasitica NIES-267]|uniref:Beta-ketoacyl synthase n=1 Tax=Calothrix parasitica NIES-267 TaxID=1973488 RepID=A0A1Z4LRV2_9CYAN|nr:beta-ketoacyl synthase [Calothrix parasitica NIES-267]